MKSNKQTNPKSTPICSMCGLCCKLFLINLNKEEYLSGEYQTVFDDIANFDNFPEAEKAGAIFLSQNNEGGCVYLTDNKCNIHNNRPAACKDFFCKESDIKYKSMRDEIEKARKA